MDPRRGEKIGWTGGWLGGFVWVLILSLVFAVQGNWRTALSGLIVVGLAVAAVLFGAPWRHPTTPYWRLMLAPYGLFLGSVAWAFLTYGGMAETGFGLMQWLLLLLPLIPLGQHARRTWQDGGGQTPPQSPRQ